MIIMDLINGYDCMSVNYLLCIIAGGLILLINMLRCVCLSCAIHTNINKP